MVQKIYQNSRYLGNIAQYVADTVEDVKEIKLLPGSMGCEVYVIETKTTYILDSKYVWHSKTSDDTIECNCIEESTIWDTLPEPTEN